jgi:hypothetical protein
MVFGFPLGERHERKDKVAFTGFALPDCCRSGLHGYSPNRGGFWELFDQFRWFLKARGLARCTSPFREQHILGSRACVFSRIMVDKQEAKVDFE